MQAREDLFEEAASWTVLSMLYLSSLCENPVLFGITQVAPTSSPLPKKAPAGEEDTLSCEDT